MKLDYLQFLELEVFTRFGAKLESTMEKKIERGRCLREIFKQDRLDPIPIEWQLAWLVAFNDGLFDSMKPEAMGQALASLFKFMSISQPTLAAPRDQWRTWLEAWKKGSGVS